MKTLEDILLENNHQQLYQKEPFVLTERIRKIPRGKNHYLYKGNMAGYGTKHDWIKRWYGRAYKCEYCGTKTAKRYEWANKSGKYLRDISDYIQLCKKCHNAYDFKFLYGNNCKRGHPFVGVNTKRDKKGKRFCMVCARLNAREKQIEKGIKPHIDKYLKDNEFHAPIKKWSEKEILFLKNNYKTMLQKDMAIKLNRTKSAISTKVLKLGFIKRQLLPKDTLF